MLAAVALLATSAAAQTSIAPATDSHAPLDSFDYIIGTQHIGNLYHFTNKPMLIEGADAILAMGSNMIKISMSPKYENYIGSEDPHIQSLTDLAEQKDFAQLFSMPFSRYFIWTTAFSTHGKVTPWRGHVKPEVLAAEYKEIYDFTRYLLTTYNGTGKSFYLGNWEGDWMLLSGVPGRDDPKMKSKINVPPDAIVGMIDWATTRQRAVDDAKRDVPHQNVQVWYYVEANHVLKSIHEGRISVSSSVLGPVNPDFVSFSSYDATNADRDLNRDLPDALNYMQSKLKPKPGLPEKRVFIGEYGAPARSYSPQGQADRIREVSAAAIKWGTPFVLYWELYNNEKKKDSGEQAGFWLIDDKGVKQPAYYMYQHYYADASRFVAEFTAKNSRPPSDKEFQTYAYKWLTTKH
jgi:hypothetical protein